MTFLCKDMTIDDPWLINNNLDRLIDGSKSHNHENSQHISKNPRSVN